MVVRLSLRALIALAAVLCVTGSAMAATVNPASALHWRFVGPLRAGRTVAISGVPTQPNVFYIGAVNGGVWRTDDAGRTWDPLFDAQPTQSIGAIAVAPSDPSVVYVGSGEGLRRPDLAIGDGMWKSTDAGKHWSHIGLDDAQQIGGIAVDPHNPNRVFAAVMGHPYGPNATRGLYRSTDGGITWKHVLGPTDSNIGAVGVVIDPNNTNTVYADIWGSRNGPWHFFGIYQTWSADGLYKSTDGGTTWTQLHGGLPNNLGHVGITVSPADSKRLYAWVNTKTTCGIYRSDDAGATWKQTNAEQRVCERGDDFSGITAAPNDPNTVWVANTSTYRSTDGGATFVAIKGAPGGDDYHTIWINPLHPNYMGLAVDQGATISVNGGRTWSSWYNQPTGQMYHVSADNRFPYWVCGGQQDSGTACVQSRSDMGAITMRNWHPVGGEEYGDVVADPLHPGVFFAGKVTRYSERTNQVRDVSPFRLGGKKYRYDRTAPLIFNRVDHRTLYVGANVLFATSNAGQSWRIISPDLSRAHAGVPKTLDGFLAPDAKHPKGVIYALAPSYRNANTIWAGTDDGLVWLTHDGGKHWNNVTPPGLTAWSKISQIDVSHFDDHSAYLAVTRFRLDDLTPYIYVTHDDGKHWRLATGGLPKTPVDAVRADPVRPGLLYAATEIGGVWYSLDDGAHWATLNNNLPQSSMRDIIVHGDDLIVATHGRGFWILDDVAPLREWKPAIALRASYLFAPAVAYRVRRDLNQDTPLPPEEPMGQNPPDGAMLDYYLGTSAHTVSIAILDARGNIVRRMSNFDAAPAPLRGLDKPHWWEAPTVWPGTTSGMHRFIWDLRGAMPIVNDPDLPISAIPHATPRVPRGVLVPPGRYTVELTVDGHTSSRPILILPDPRLRTTAHAYQEQYRLATQLSAAMTRLSKRAHAAALEGRIEDAYAALTESDTGPTQQLFARISRLLSQAHAILAHS